MANFGWAYVDCSEVGTGTGGQAAGPTGSVQFLTGHNATNGLDKFMYHTASDGTVHPYTPSTLVLSGNLIVTGAISASTYHIKDIAVVDATGSTSFGDTNDDTHIRTGSLIVGPIGVGTSYTLSASVADEVVYVKGFAGGLSTINTSPYTLTVNSHIFGVIRTSATVLNLPAANTVPIGLVWTIKDQVTSRTGAGNNITLTSSSPTQQTIDGEEAYVLTGTMPAISLYSNGLNWFVF